MKSILDALFAILVAIILLPIILLYRLMGLVLLVSVLLSPIIAVVLIVWLVAR